MHPRRTLPAAQALLWILAVAVTAFACRSATPPPRAPEDYLQASPIVEQGLPSVDPMDGEPSDTLLLVDSPELAAPEAEDLRAAPPAPVSPASAGAPVPANAPPASPKDVIARANASASQAPDADGFVNAIMSYTFQQGGLYKVFAAPDNVTDLVLEPGEEIMGEPAAGDTLRWRLGVGTSAVDGVAQQHVFIKPTRAGLKTNLTINTSRRTYFLQLESVEGEFMVAVQWSYPQTPPLAPAAGSAAPAPSPPEPTPPVDLNALNFDYAIEVAEGHPSWKPLAVYDDGAKTFIRFPARILHGEAPVLFVVERGEKQLVNYRVQQSLYVVDRLFEVAELQLGQQDQDVVRLRNLRRSRATAPAPRRPSASSPRRPGTPL